MRYITTGIIQWALGAVRYSAKVFDWTRGDLSRIDGKTKKILRKRKTGGRELISVEDSVLSECNGLREYVETSNEPMLKGIEIEDFLTETMGKEEY